MFIIIATMTFCYFVNPQTFLFGQTKDDNPIYYHFQKIPQKKQPLLKITI